MKKLLLIFIASCGAYSVIAQTDTTMSRKKNFTHDRDLSRWVLDINLLGGVYTQNLTAVNNLAGYTNEIASLSNSGNLKFENGSSFGGDIQVGYFFGKNKHWGIGTGFMYLYQQGDATLDNFAVQYQSTDEHGNTFRQIITGDNVKEHITSSNMNIPLVLKYKDRFSKHWGFTADAGALFNLQMKNTYNNNNSSFDYEAIYAYSEGAAVYDPNPTPLGTDVLYTKAFIQAHVSAPNTVASEFAKLENAGYNVGLGVKPNNSTGSVSYNTFSVGLLLQPSINYFLSDAVALNLGAYYIFQPFKNDAESNYTLTNKVGDYSSVLNNVSSSNAQTYGLNLGVRIFLGRPKLPPATTSIDKMPTLCGTCDGLMTIHGLQPGKDAAINYSYNGVAQAEYIGTADDNGNVTIRNLCAGSYTNITAKIRKHTVAIPAVDITAPALVISSETSTNPTANGRCDGTIIFKGLFADKQVNISYSLNGVPQPGYTGMVKADKTVTFTNLCAGTYSGFVATIGSCTANGADVTLTDPPAVLPMSPTLLPVAERPDISLPILFNFNQATVHKVSIPLIEEAAEELKADPNATITVDGYTDAIGSESYNNGLSVRRANAVKDRLRQYGISPKRVKVVGHGKSNPAATNKTPEGRSQNRRAIMKYEEHGNDSGQNNNSPDQGNKDHMGQKVNTNKK